MRRVALAPIAGAAKPPEAAPGGGNNHSREIVMQMSGSTV